MNQIFPTAPQWLVGLVAAASVISLYISLYFLVWAAPKPKKQITDALYDLAVSGNILMTEKVKDSVDVIFYKRKVQNWINSVEVILKDEMKEEELHMFSTVPPMLGTDDDEAICRAAIANRVVKLRNITGRYFRGENIK